MSLLCRHCHYLFLIPFLFYFQLLSGAPIVTSLNPLIGSNAGGDTVNIVGSGFSGATAVMFGTQNAMSYTVHSDTLITAISPAEVPAAALSAHVTVTVGADVSPSTNSDYFSYQGDWFAYIGIPPSGLLPLNTSTDMYNMPIPPSGEFFAAGLTLSSDGNTAYSGVNISISPPSTEGEISIYDLITNTKLQDVSLGSGNVIQIAYVPQNATNNGPLLYACDNGSDVVHVLNLNTNPPTVTEIPSVGARNVAISPDSNLAYVAGFVDTEPTLTIIDIATNLAGTPISLTPASTESSGMAITPDGNTLLISFFEDLVFQMDISSSTPTLTHSFTSFGNSIADIITAPDSITAYALVSGTPNASIFPLNLTTEEIGSGILVGNTPQTVVVTPDGKKLYISDEVAGEYIIDLTAITPTSTLNNTYQDNASGAITPDQAPIATFTSTLEPAGVPSTFDGSGSLSPHGSIAQYIWSFDGNAQLPSASPVTTHTFTPGSHTATLTVVNTAGTSTDTVWTGRTMLRNGGPNATISQTIMIAGSLAPTVTNISPNNGSVLGGTTVTITGTNFIQNQTTVSLGGGSAITPISISLDGTSLTFVTPAHIAGTLAVVVTTPDGSTAETPITFVYESDIQSPVNFRGNQLKNKFISQIDRYNVLTWEAPKSGPGIAYYRISRNTLSSVIAEIPVSADLSYSDHNRKKIPQPRITLLQWV